MDVKVEKKDKNIVELEIEVEAAKFEEAVQKSYEKNSKKFNVPGFRKGKAPRNIIERYYGKEVFYEDAINIVCADAYDKAIEENDIYPVDRPSIDIKKFGEGENLVFTASVTVKPEVELGEYKGVEVEKVEVNITDEDVDKELKAVAEKNARIISVEDRGIEKGDIADIDFEGFIDGEPFEGGKASGYTLEIGSGTFIEGFEDQLIGGKPGDDIDVNVTFPEDYGKEELAGKPALFKVIVNDVKVKELPVIDDEFAKDVSEFDTLEEYKEDIRKKLTGDAEHKAKHELEDKVVAKVVENAQVDIPEVMIEKQIDGIVRDYNMRLNYQGLDLDKYLMIMGTDYNTFRSQLRDRAHDDIKRQLVLEKIGKTEDIQVSDEEFNEETEKIAKSYNMEQEDFKKHLRDDDIEYIKATILLRKSVEFLVQNAKIS
ncbi:trigger factor [Acetivibrio mesophilus]|uniref:Trigger factor n=1 Tax=Acetivibrio mesophilus TaxID=2487273 RepID=A0A4V1K293_9FIRM|nr:trigger factor [Acetivibrio mesophilus]ODM27530.1 trigger factor [Clostridium sp. Bc-iso-3]RXE59489.1 trigger factor [Acetivibrio mesophilus]HHV30282.1 trigger factor [Clostridium sp.]